jgi:hypothetical protein
MDHNKSYVKKMSEAIIRSPVIQAYQLIALFVGIAGAREDGTRGLQLGRVIILNFKQPHIPYVSVSI